MAWQFDNRIFAPQKPFTSTDTSEAIRTLYESGDETVTLRAHQSAEGFTNAEKFTLEGKGYASSDEAYAAGKLWRQYLSVAFANAGFVVILDSDALGTREGERERSLDAPGLRVSPQPRGSTFGFMSSQAYGKVTRPIDLFVSDVSTARQLIPNGLNPRVELAYTAFHAASAVDNPEVRYILLVTAIEALIPDDKPEKQDKELVAALRESRAELIESERWTERIRLRIAKVLEDAQLESILRLGKNLAEKLEPNKYDGKSAKRFFADTYEGRSALVHGNVNHEERPSPRDIGRTWPELRKFVLDLLTVESTESATPTSPATSD